MRTVFSRLHHTALSIQAGRYSLRKHDIISIIIPFGLCGILGVIAMFLADGGGPLFAGGLLSMALGICLSVIRLARRMIAFWASAYGRSKRA